MLRTTAAFPRLAGHEVHIYNDAYIDADRVVVQVADSDALLLTQQRVRITRDILERLPKLRFISQTGKDVYHLDVDACTERGIVVSAAGGSDGYETLYRLAVDQLLAYAEGEPINVIDPQAQNERG